MAKANLDTFPPTVLRISKHYQTTQKTNHEKWPSTSNVIGDVADNSQLVASDTLSDWRRKSTAASPSHYPSEHRRDRRRISSLNVHLHKQGKPLGTTRTYDVNAKGISIECGKLDLHEGEVVEIDLPENAAPEGVSPHACCLVVHTGTQCGLMFLDLKDR